MAKTNIYLYGALDANVADSYNAKEYLDAEGIQYTHLFYSDPAQHKAVLDPVSSWFPKGEKVTAFPFVVWDEDGDRRVAKGLKEIKATVFQTAPKTPKKP